MISHKHKFILILPPKTASTTLVKALMDFVDISKIIDQPTLGTFDFLENGSSEHRKHTELKTYSSDYINTYKLYGVVRNPYERMVSWWLWRRRFLQENESFLDFLKLSNQWMDINYYQYFGGKKIGILRHENLASDFASFCDEVGIPRQKLPHLNKSKHKHYAEYYDEETKQIVSEKYAKDIEYFGYKFGE